MTGTTLNSMMNKSPKPWTWLVGAAALVGGFTWLRKKNMDVSHRSSGSILPERTRVDITERD
jgi:hypothetical protein